MLPRKDRVLCIVLCFRWRGRLRYDVKLPVAEVGLTTSEGLGV